MANVNYTVTGVEDARNNLAKAIQRIEIHTREGIRESVKFVKSEAQDLTSIDTGDLIASAFFRTGFLDAAKTKPIGLVGYKVEYAAAVHEMSDETNWQRPGAENKFLEKSVVRNFTKIFNIIKRFASRNP